MKKALDLAGLDAAKSRERSTAPWSWTLQSRSQWAAASGPLLFLNLVTVRASSLPYLDKFEYFPLA
jgi:hypothetical protein